MQLKLCVVPLSVRLENRISARAKIYLGELCGLSDQNGYCAVSVEKMAETKGVTTHTIRNWNRSLEKFGFIRIDNGKIYVI